jgi:hypothetical protein
MYAFEYDENGNLVCDENNLPVVVETTDKNSKSVSAAPSFWETDIDIDTKTIYTKESVPVYMSEKAQEKIAILMQKFVHMEWLAYLVGKKCDDGSYYIEDLAIPKQEVTVVNVYVKGSVDVPIIGVIHSHHDMGNNFSHTDDEYINSNHDLSLCVCNNGINGQVRIRKDDVNYEIAPVEVFEYCSFDKEQFLESVDELIKERRYTYTARNYGASASVDESVGEFYKGVSKRNVLGAVDEYKYLIKNDETNGVLDLDEVFFMYVLINNLHSDSFDDIMGFVYDGTVNITLEAIDLMDELDIYRDDLTHNESVKINQLYNYLSDLLEKYNYQPTDNEDNK